MEKEETPKCHTLMKKIGSWKAEEAYEDFDAEYITLYQCPECKEIKIIKN